MVYGQFFIERRGAFIRDRGRNMVGEVKANSVSMATRTYPWHQRNHFQGKENQVC